MPWGSVPTVKAKIFHNTNETDEGENVSVTNKVTPCPKNNHLPPKIVKNVADEVKNVSLKETKTKVKYSEMNNLKKHVMRMLR